MDKYFVYKHVRLDTSEVFYIGIGKIRISDDATTWKMKHYRAFSKQGRNPIWKRIVAKTEYEVEVIHDDLSKKEAIEHEMCLINDIGRRCDSSGVLSNISIGGETVKDEMITVLNDKKCSRIVYQYSIEGHFIKEWPSTNQIKRDLGYDNSVLRKAIKGKTKSPNISYGFQWFEEYRGEIIPPSDSGKTTLHKGVILVSDKETLVFKSRKACADSFNVASSQVTYAIRNKYKFKGYKVFDYDKSKEKRT